MQCNACRLREQPADVKPREPVQAGQRDRDHDRRQARPGPSHGDDAPVNGQGERIAIRAELPGCAIPAKASGRLGADSAWPEKAQSGIVSATKHMAWMTATAPTHCAPNTSGATRPSSVSNGSQIVAVSTTMS